MDIEEEVRALMHKLNHAKGGVGKAASITGWETKMTEDVDGMPLGMEQSKKYWHPLGGVGPASPCCDAPGDEHADDCAMRGRDDDHPWSDTQ